MDFIKQKKFVSILIAVLAAMNIVTIALLWIGRPQQGRFGFPPPENNKAQLKDILSDAMGFDTLQIEKFMKLRNIHHQKIERLNLEINKVKKEMFDRALEDNDDQNISDSLLAISQSKQAEIEKLTYHHFIEIKNLCTKEQKLILKEILPQIFQKPVIPGQLPPR